MAGIAAATLLGALLRRYHLGASGLWLDELGEAVVASREVPALLAGVREHAGASPLDYLGVKLVTSVLGTSTVATRLWSAIAGTLAIPLIGICATALFRSRIAGVVAALMLAVSAFHIGYSQEARFYALTVLIGIALFLAFDNAQRSGRWLDWAWFGMAVVAALYTNVTLMLVIAPIVVAHYGHAAAGLIRHRSQQAAQGWNAALIRPAGALAVAGLLFLPWLVFATAYQAGRMYAYKELGPLPPQLGNIVASLLVPEWSVGFPRSPVGVWPLPLSGLVVAVAIIGLAAAWPWRPAMTGLAISAVIVIPAIWLVDSRSHLYFDTRHVISLLPIIILPASAGVALLAAKPHRFRALPVLCAGVLLVWGAANVMGAAHYYAAASTSKPAWEDAGRYVAGNVCPQSRVYVNVGGDADGIGYHEPALTRRSAYVAINERHPAMEAISILPLKKADWVILQITYWVVRQNGLHRITRELQTEGFSYRDFSMIRVFSQTKCPG